MKKTEKRMAWILALALMLCGAAGLTSRMVVAAAEEGMIECAIEDGGYTIRIPDPSGDLGWVADDMAQDDSVVKLTDAALTDGEFVVRYEPVGDGDVTVGVRHYIGIACDQAMTWDLSVRDGAVQEVTGGSHTVAPDAAEQDPLLSGAWTGDEQGSVEMAIARNENRGWDVVITDAGAEVPWVFKTTIYYDCDLDSFVYDKGKFWDLPADAQAELGEARVAGTTGTFVITGDEQGLGLTWYDDETPEREIAFRPTGAEEEAQIDYGDSQLYTRADMDEAIALIREEFDSWEGCRMHSLRYAGDACNTEENIRWLNEIREGRNYTRCMEILSDFHSPVEGGGAWEPDEEYRDWQWWLGCGEDGRWELASWGY